jgi:anti-anti-sigma regulatory factor
MFDSVKKIIEEDFNLLVEYWLDYFNENEKEAQRRYYSDFLSFFEECIDNELNREDESFEVLIKFLEKLMEIVGDREFFHFRHSIYSSYLKYPILRRLKEKDKFDFILVAKITSFFDTLSSRLIIAHINKTTDLVKGMEEELEIRESAVSEISDGVLLTVIVGLLDSDRVMKIIDKILDKIEQLETKAVIIDITHIEDMNSEIANQLIKLKNSIHFMGVEAIISGINKNVAKRLTHLQINLGEMKTFRNIKDALKAINEL